MEFKRLSDVEVVAEPTETANVLIEENGVIKKAPKTAVGGGSGNNIIITMEQEQEPVPTDADSSDILEGVTCNKTFDEVVEMYTSGDIDLVMVKGVEIDGNNIIGMQFMFPTLMSLLDINGDIATTHESVECIAFYLEGMPLCYYRNGFSMTEPSNAPG